jgi:uncharacterized membrane protein YkoI
MTRQSDTAEKKRRRRPRSVWLALVLAIGLAPPLAYGEDYDEARRLRETGKILPLQEVLRRQRRVVGPRVLEVELEKRRGRYVYGVESLDKGGAVKRHYFDATTGKPLGAKRRN